MRTHRVAAAVALLGSILVGEAASAQSTKDIRTFVAPYLADPNQTDLQNASQYDMVDVFGDDASTIHGYNPQAVVLKYRAMSALGGDPPNPDPEWPTANQSTNGFFANEDWFIHDAYLAPSLAHYWPVNETSGTTTADTGAQTPLLGGTLQNGAAFQTDAGTGRKAIKFDGTDDRVATTCGSSNCNLAGTDYTVSAWFKFTSKTSSASYILQAGSTAVYSLTVNTNGTIQYFHRATSGTNLSIVSSGTTNYADNNWHHVAIVVEATPRAARMYVDGKPTGNVPSFNTLASLTSGSLWIGGGNPTSRSAKGLIDDVRIYRRALNQTEARWSTGHRLIDYEWCGRQMDTGSGWRGFSASQVASYLAGNPADDGFFADTASDYIPTGMYWAEIANEKRIMAAAGNTVTPEFPIFNGIKDNGSQSICTPFNVGGIWGVTGVWDNSGHTGTNWKGSVSGNVITLTKSFAANTPLYIQYTAREKGGRIEPDPAKMATAAADMAGMFDAIRTSLGPTRTLIINTNLSSTIVNRTSVTGKMAEDFLGDTSWYWWQNNLDDERAVLAYPKVYVAHSADVITDPNTNRVALRFKFGSHLLVADPTYSYFSYCWDGLPCHASPAPPPEYGIALGLPKGPMTLRSEGDPRTNVVSGNNPSFENYSGTSPTNWASTGAPNGTFSVDTSGAPPEGARSLHVSLPAGNTGGYMVYSTVCAPIPSDQRSAPLELSAWFRGNITGGTEWWQSAAVTFLYYTDTSCTWPNTVPGGIGITSRKGSFDWQYVTGVTSGPPPASAQSIQINAVGLQPTATGDVWIDDVRLASTGSGNYEYAVFGRDFTGGTVLVNPGRGPTPTAVQLPYPHVDLDGTPMTQITIPGKQAAILRGDQVGYWQLDAPASASVPDSSLAQHPGTFSLGTAGNQDFNAATGVGRRAGQTAFVFDGVDDWISLGNSTADWNVGAGDYSVSGWFKFNWGLNTASTILRRLEGTAGFSLSVVNQTTNSPIVFEQKTTTSDGCLLQTANANYTDNVWHHAVAVVRAQRGTCELWVDGVLKVQDTFTGTPVDYSGTQPLSISYPPNFGQQAFGSIDEVKLFRRALTPPEITALWSN